MQRPRKNPPKKACGIIANWKRAFLLPRFFTRRVNLLTQRVQGWARNIARQAAQIFVRTPITPNMLTLFGLVLNGVVAWLLATEHLVAGGLVMIFAGLFDMLDGALAKI